MFVNSDFLHEYDFFALSTADSASRHGCFFTHDFSICARRTKLLCVKTAQTDLFQGRCCLAEFFKHKYCHASHTSFAFFFHLPSYIGKGHKHSRKRKLRQPMYGNLGSPIYLSWRNKRKKGDNRLLRTYVKSNQSEGILGSGIPERAFGV